MTAMRQFALVTVGLASLVVLPACVVYSLRPLYDDKHLAYDPDLEGTWQQKPGDCLMVISGDAKKQEYTLKYAIPPENKDGCRENDGNDPGWDQAGPFSGRLVQLGAARFLDAFPKDGDLTKLGYISGHFIFKVWADGSKLSLTPPSDKWLCDATREKKLNLGECMEGPDSDFVFTASTEALQDFAQKHANDDQLFPEQDEGPLYRVQKLGASK
jgi:hypothetical protein